MKNIFIVAAFTASLFGISCSGTKQSIGVLFSKVTSYPPYYVMMDIPVNHTPVWWNGTDIWENIFEFKDGSYIYFLRDGINPNLTRLKSSIGDSLFYQRFGYVSYDYYNPHGDSLFSITYEGVDSAGLCWKDVHYLLPDSLCVVKRRGVLVQTWKSDNFRVTIGYARVPPSAKGIYDKALNSFKLVRLSEADSSYMQLLDTSYGYNSRFRYITTHQQIIDDKSTVKIDIYKESKSR
jgi:hypothetical protein